MRFEKQKLKNEEGKTRTRAPNVFHNFYSDISYSLASGVEHRAREKEPCPPNSKEEVREM